MCLRRFSFRCELCIEKRDKSNRDNLSLGSDNMKNEKPKIVVIGVGNMGAAIVRGLIDASVTGLRMS